LCVLKTPMAENKSASMTKKTALICGVSGQDGSYLAALLLSKGYTVFGTSRDAQGSSFANLRKLGIQDHITFLSMVPEDFRSVLVALRKSNPDEIYYLAGQSSVGLSFEQPAETMQSITMGTLNILEGCRMLETANKPMKVYHAGSGECFGDTQGQPANEITPFYPMSPYAVAKSSAYWLVNNYREAYGLFACTGILFNHESALRPERFVTQKIVRAVKRIAQGSTEKLKLGRLDIARDWGWAPEYVEAMWLMLQQEKPHDYVIATGVTMSLEEFVQAAFTQAGLNWRNYVEQDPALFRPTDLAVGRADPTKANRELGWKATTKGIDVVKKMYELI
jgi:GDPmannose 4,6-dehydratase